jgi:hypothetical protein
MEVDAGIEEKSGLDDADKSSNIAGDVIKAASEPADSDPDNETAAKERVRKITGTVVDTGLGKIIKHTDGSFEY